MRRLALLLLLIAPACAARYRTETLGSGTAGGAGVTLSRPGLHTVTWAVTTPRALKLRWSLACGGATVEGSTGEAFADYEARRLAELRAEQQRERDAVASLVGAVGAAAVVRTPDAEASAEVHADGDAVAEVVVSDDVALPAGDVGAGVYHGTASISAIEPGACTMTVAPEDPAEDPAGVLAEFSVTREINLAVERAQEQARRRDAALDVRGALTASLVAQGADPEHQRRLAAEREAELRIRVDVEAQAQVELDAQLAAEATVRVDVEAQRLAGAIAVRGRLRDSLIAQGADPELQARMLVEREAELRIRLDVEARAQAELDARLQAEAAARDEARWQREQDELHAELAVRAEIEVRVDAALEVRARLAASLIAQGADPDYQWRLRAQRDEELRLRAEADDARLWAVQAERDRLGAERARRYDGAIAARLDLLAYLEGLGAFAPPPMPAPLYEDTGESPGSGSVWIAGEWVWRGRQWQWITGGWSIPSGPATVEVVETVDTTVDGTSDAGVSVGVSIPVPVIVIDHRDDPPPPKRPKTRDHRK